MEHSYSVISGNTSPNNQTTEGWEGFDHIVSTFLTEQKIPGASVAVSRNGRILYQQGYGMAGGGRRVHTNSLFRIASISKPITAAIILHLCDEHKLSLDTKVFGKGGILKTYRTRDKRMKNITIKHLLQHSAGWDRDKVGDAVFVRPQCVMKEHPDSQTFNSALLAYSLRRKLQFSPGTWHSYSNLGYLILGEIVEILGGQPFHQTMKTFLQDLNIYDVIVGKRERAPWNSREVEYFNNREPQVVDSLYPGEGKVLPQYGGMAMESSGSYGGLVSDTVSLLKFVHCMEQALDVACGDEGTGQYDNKQDQNRRTEKLEFLHGFDSINNGTQECVHCSDICNKTQGCNHHSNNICKRFKEYVHCSDPISNGIQECMHCFDPTCNRTLECVHGFSDTNSGTQECICGYNDSKLMKPLLKPTQAIEIFSRPDYENGCDWYGLGWDVQDNGKSWGHTGGMEGSCGTLFHHQSGFNWAFLLNSWAVDSDLNGVIKYALCSVPHLKMYNQDTLSYNNDFGVRIVTCDRLQIIFLYVSESAIMKIISSMKADGFFMTWVSCMSQDVSCEQLGNEQDCEWQGDKQQGGLWQGDKQQGNEWQSDKQQGNEWQSDKQQGNEWQSDKQLGNAWQSDKQQGGGRNEPQQHKFYESKKFEQKYVAIFQKSQVKEYFAVFNKTVAELKGNIKKFETENYVIHFLDSFVDSCFQLRYTAIFKYNGTVRCGDTVVFLALKAKNYVKYIKYYLESYNLMVQSVTEVSDDLLVSAILTPRTACSRRSQMVVTKCRADTCQYLTTRTKKDLPNRSYEQTHVCSDMTAESSSRLRMQHCITNKEVGHYWERSFLEPVKEDSNKWNLTNSLLEPMDCDHGQSLTQIIEESSLKSKKNIKSNIRALASSKSIYWVQISPESFLTELNRQVKRHSSLVYAKFYTSDRKPYVSGCWLSHTAGNCYQRISMSKYGLVPELIEAASSNIHLHCLSEYAEEDGVRYFAAIWYAS